jgi:chemotaxis protein CheX
MDASYVNPFVQGAQRVFANVCQETPSLGKVFVKPQPYTTFPVSISITIKGAFNGEVVYTMEDPAGCYLASRMMMNLPIPTLYGDVIAQSAVAELANIITGNVATLFAVKDIRVDITPPTLKFNASADDFPTAAKVAKVVCVPLLFQNGHIFEVDVLIP